MAGRDVDPILRSMLQDLFDADCRGARRERLARAHGYTDGYMRALVDLGVATEKELLQVVIEERTKAAQKPQPRVRPARSAPMTEPATAAVPSLGFSV